MMDIRHGNRPRNRWAAGIRMATLLVVMATLAVVWYPQRSDVSTDSPDAGSATTATATPAFPRRFPAPDGIDPEPQPTF